jgi:hypothetical protein
LHKLGEAAEKREERGDKRERRRDADVLTDRHSQQDPKLYDKLFGKHGEQLDERSLTICSGVDYTNINYQHVVCPDSATAKVTPSIAVKRDSGGNARHFRAPLSFGLPISRAKLQSDHAARLFRLLSPLKLPSPYVAAVIALRTNERPDFN